MKKQKCLLLLVAAMAFALAACSDLANGEAEGSAYITISLGGSEGRKAVPWANGVDDGSILHDIFIDGNSVGTGVKIGDGVKNYKANPGSHTVSVCGYYPAGTLFSYGEKTVTVVSGQKAKCDITMLAAPSLSGTITISPPTGAVINQDLTADYSGSETVSFQWEKDGVKVGTASTTKPNKFKPTEGGIYTVTVSATGYKPKTSDPVTVNDPSLLTLTGNITINPNTGVHTGTLLTASYIGSESVTLTYHWEKDGASLGVTGNTYTPTQAGSYSVIGRATGYNEKPSAAVTVTDITYTASPNVVKNTTAINFTFSAAVSGLTSSEITVTNGTGAAAKGALTENSGTSWSLAITVTTAGNVSVSINKTGIESGAKTVAVAVQGDGSTGKPFLVFDKDDLSHIGKPAAGDYPAWPLDKHYKQMDNIDLASISNWTPIGTETAPFTGSYDGNGHTINNLKITSTTADGVGLFGWTNSGAIVVKNVGIVNCDITSSNSNDFVGGVVGTTDEGDTVLNCYVTGTVSATGTYSSAGGVVGYNYGGTVQYCYSTCNVSGISNVGGVVGTNDGTTAKPGTVQNCYSTGNVSVTGTTGIVGGVAGRNDGVRGKVQNCYATGTVTGTSTWEPLVGGVLGGGTNAKVENCVALNPNISTAGDLSYTGRVGGACGPTTAAAGSGNNMANNYGRADMKRNGNDFDWNTVGTSFGTTGKYGADITADDWKLANWWQTQGFTATDWDFSGINDGIHLPKLKNMPGGLEAQNPTIQ